MSKATKATKGRGNDKYNALVSGVTNKITNTKDSIKNLKGSMATIDFAVLGGDSIKVFGGLMNFPYFKEKYKQDCSAEEYNKRYLELMKKRDKPNLEASKPFSETGSYFPFHEKEKPIFIKEFVKIDCNPKPPTLRKGLSKKNQGCWDTSECEVNKGLYCDSKMKYTRGVCRKK